MFTIDKSVFTAEELEQYEALIAKAKVDPEANQEEMEDDVPPEDPAKKGCKKPAKKAEVEDVEDTKKSAAPEVPDFVKAAIAKSEEYITKAEKKEMAEVAKKYAALVPSVDDLAEKLYNLKKSDEAMYETCIAMMDSQAAMVEKSGIFTEIGKSGGGFSTSGGAQAKAEAKAQEIMKSDSTVSYTDAIAKAWADPDIMAEYDAEYYKR